MHQSVMIKKHSASEDWTVNKTTAEYDIKISEC